MGHQLTQLNFSFQAPLPPCVGHSNHLQRVSLIFSLIDATPKCSRKCSFLILSLPPLPHIHLNIHFVIGLIGHSWFNHYLVKFSLQSFWYSLVTKYFRSKSLLQTSHLYPIFDIFINLLILTNYQANVTGESLCGISWASIFTVVSALCIYPLKL